jgi:hypothetical protein
MISKNSRNKSKEFLEGLDEKLKIRKPKTGTWTSIRLDCIHKLGFALVYMQYLHNEIEWYPQLSRVVTLCYELKTYQNSNDKAFWDDFLERIIDETDNLC